MPLTVKMSANGATFVRGIERGMVFWAKVEQGKGSEHGHDVGLSPWLIMSTAQVHNKLPIVQAVPLTSQVQQMKTYETFRILIPNEAFRMIPGSKHRLSGDSLALIEQVRALAQLRLDGDPCARLDRSYVGQVEVALKFVLGIP